MEQFYEALDLLKGMIAIPSFSREEKEVADYLQSRWTEAGHNVYRKGANLWLSTAIESDRPSILLNSHIDTVRPTSGWTRNPFEPDDSPDDALYGLGSNDAGASIVALYETFVSLSRRKQPCNLIFLASAEEEISGTGGVESVLPSLPPIAFAVVGEPTGMNPAIAEKGLMVLDCTAAGKAGHAARDEGVNAIALALPDIEWFNSFRFPNESEWLGAVKMSVTQIKAGTQHNVVPDRCEFVVDVRSNDCYSNAELLQQVIAQVKCSVAPRSVRLNSSHLDRLHPFVQRAETLGRYPFGSPTLSDQALMPFPSVKIGPGESSRSHSADEYVRPSEIRESIDLYTRLLDGITIR